MKTNLSFSIITSFCLLFFVAGAGAADPDVSNAPSAYLPDLHHVFEPVVDGTSIIHDFILENKGTAPLEIEKVKTDWGCTAVSYPSQIPPGGEGKIKIKVNTNGYGGKRLKKNITVKTNDPQKRWLYLSVTGQVEIFANIAPPKVFLRGMAGEPLNKTVKIIPLEKYPFKIESVHATGQNHIRYALKEVQRSRGVSYELAVENLQKKKGRYYEIISLKTDSDIKPVIKISVVGYIFEPKQGGKK